MNDGVTGNIGDYGSSKLTLRMSEAVNGIVDALVEVLVSC